MTKVLVIFMGTCFYFIIKSYFSFVWHLRLYIFIGEKKKEHGKQGKSGP